MNKFIYILFFILILFSECVEPFDASIDKYENLLVVDGMITNDSGPYSVKLSRSTTTNNTGFIYVPDATIIISDDKGNSEQLTEIRAGQYTTGESGIQGVINNSYKIYIKTADGNEYESEFQELLPSANIDSLYGLVDFQTTDDTGILHEGYQFFVETQTQTEETSYFLWIPIETYKYHADYRIEYYIYNNEVLEFPNPDSLYTCWRTNTIQNVYTLKTEANTGYIQSPLHFVSADTEKLSEGYSLLVKQLSIDYEAYQYFDNIKKILSQGESLYNIQPFQIIGNIKNINNPEEAVLGFFTVAGTDEKRIFTDIIQPTYYPYSHCVPNVLRWGNSVAYGSVETVYGVTNDDGVVGALGGSCIDCTANGGTTERPDYWINK